MPKSRDRSCSQMGRQGERLGTLKIKKSEYSITAYLPWHSNRNHVEQFITQQFAEKHGAQIEDFMPALIALENSAGEICAVAGMRTARHEKLFLEKYIDLPIEKITSSALNAKVHRNKLVEIGNLASTRKGYSRYLFVALTALLVKWDLIWLSFTGTKQVLNVFTQLGLSPVVVAPAQKERLGNEQQKWGRYYQNTPYVMVGNVLGGDQTLSQLGVYQALQLSLYSGDSDVLSA